MKTMDFQYTSRLSYKLFAWLPDAKIGAPVGETYRTAQYTLHRYNKSLNKSYNLNYPTNK
jgi:hypothetical protein